MPIKMHCFKASMVLVPMFVLIGYLAGPVYGDETPATPSGEGKCGSCTPSPPPPTPSPPPPSPSPPPPALPPPEKPPPSPKKPPSTPYCPPPPSSIHPSPPSSLYPSPPSSLFYITGPPGELYPVDHSFNGASRSLVTRLPFFFGCGFLGLLLAFWG